MASKRTDPNWFKQWEVQHKFSSNTILLGSGYFPSHFSWSLPLGWLSSWLQMIARSIWGYLTPYSPVITQKSWALYWLKYLWLNQLCTGDCQVLIGLNLCHLNQLLSQEGWNCFDWLLPIPLDSLFYLNCFIVMQCVKSEMSINGDHKNTLDNLQSM